MTNEHPETGVLPAVTRMFAGTAAAVDFNLVKTDQSTIAFISKQMGSPVEGKFWSSARRSL